ncbi:MAG: hypothetical protein KAG53_01485 [Endozoicomonadaceae bacterium]|nr:hypothetical protein [Endozoicomonadaceae bacterium]
MADRASLETLAKLDMLETLSWLAVRLHSWKPLLWVVFIGSLLTMSVQLFRSVSLESTPLFIPALGCLLWALTGFMLTLCFQQIPARPETISRFFPRQITRIKRFGYGLLALVFMATTLGIIAITGRMLRIYIV